MRHVPPSVSCESTMVSPSEMVGRSFWRTPESEEDEACPGSCALDVAKAGLLHAANTVMVARLMSSEVGARRFRFPLTDNIGISELVDNHPEGVGEVA